MEAARSRLLRRRRSGSHGSGDQRVLASGGRSLGPGVSADRVRLVEDPRGLLEKIVAFAEQHDGIDAVVQTGSRARNQRVDAFSDLDIELIGPGAPALAGRDDWPSSLVVFAQGRKVDFTLAGPQRLRTVLADGLDSTYMRGYVVHYDPAKATRQLAPSLPRAPSWQAPTAAEFVDVQREFWFEATQVPIYAARDEPWPAQARLATAREMVLTMLEWRAGAVSGGQADTWYSGYHLDQWIDAQTKGEIAAMFPRYDTAEIIASLRAAVEQHLLAVAS